MSSPFGLRSPTATWRFDVSAKYLYKYYTVINAGVGHFFPGQVMTQNAHGAPLTIAYVSLTYRFRLN